MNSVEIFKVSDRSGVTDFLQVPHLVFADDPAWIAPLNFERRQHLSPRHNPFFEHANAQLFIARKDGRLAGRISAQVDQLRLQAVDPHTGMFGFLDAVDDKEVFSALFEAAHVWLKQQGMTHSVGPFSFSINDEAGLLVDGFQHPPAVMMGHAAPYYAGHVIAAGYEQVKDTLAYDFDNTKALPRGLAGMLEKVRASGDLEVRPLDKKNLQRDLAILIDIFNDAWSQNWGFTPFSRAEIEKLGKDLKMLVEGEFIAFANYKGKPCAMAVTLPDINRAAHDLNGQVFPFGWARLLWRLKVTAPEAVRLPLMGVRKEFHSTPVGSALALAVIDAIRTYHSRRGTNRAELSWILEDNLPMRRMIEAIGGVHYKTYRIYRQEIG